MSSIFKTTTLFILLAIAFVLPAKSQTSASTYFYDPAISPDGTEIAFVSGGDIWTVKSSGGEARLLISNPATETRPLYSPDGRSIAFNSARSGNGDIYIMDMGTGKLNRLTYDDASDELSAWSRDGKYVYFSSTSRDIAGMRDVYRIKVSGGTPMLVSDERYVTEFQATPSPDGQSVAFVARGSGATQWWRNGHSHLDESELWLMKDGVTPTYTKLAEEGARQLWPMWGADGKNLYYVSDRSGKENLWILPVGGTARQLTNFNSGRILWPSISGNEQTIVFERDFSVWAYDIKKGEAKKVNITLKGSPAGMSTEHSRLSSGIRDLAVSPDNKKLAFIVHGELFVAGAKDGGDATRITMTDDNEAQPVWSSNSNIVYYVSNRSGGTHLYKYDFITNKETQLTNDKGKDESPLLSPDGKSLAFIRDNRELRVMELSTGKETLVTKGYLGTPPFSPSGSVAWSPDNKWLAYGGFGAKSLYNIYVVSVNGGEAKPVSFLANSFGGNVVWTKDGKSILFSTAQRTETGYIARIDLVMQQPRFREDQFRDLFVDQVPSSTPEKTTTPKKDTVIEAMSEKKESNKNGTSIVWEGIRQRLSLLPIGVDPNEFIISKDGNTLVLVSTVAGQQNLYSYSLDELSREPAVLKQITTSAGRKSDIQFSPDNKDVYYLEGGRIQSVSLDSKQSKSIAVTAEMDIDFSKEKMVMFNQAWENLNEGFYDPNFHGKDWNAIKKMYEPYAAGAQTPDEMRRILSLMVGELNASHSGVNGSTNAIPSTGRIGLRFDRAVYEKEGKFKITEVVAFSPAALSGQIKVGDYLNAIDGKTLTAEQNLDQLLENKTNRKVILTIIPAMADSRTIDVTVRPVSQSTEKGLLYKQWVQQRRDYVAKVSNGRLGYVHMIDMGQGSLDQLYLDMDAENHAKEGVVIDIRNNSGGFVNAYAIDVLARRGYMNMTSRGLPEAPARVQLGQRALDAPTVLVTNQHSLSDAEDFTEGYRSLGLGKVVGEPTAGWIIYTGSVGLIDGSSIRMPFIRITDSKGKDMELNPRPVDFPVSNPLGEKGRDQQLDKAVKVLLDEIDNRKKKE